MFATFVDQQFGTNHKKLLVRAEKPSELGSTSDLFDIGSIPVSE